MEPQLTPGAAASRAINAIRQQMQNALATLENQDTFLRESIEQAESVSVAEYNEAIERLEDERTELIKALESFLDLVGDSHGVAGYHLNGDIAEWDEFDCVGEAYKLINRIEGGAA